MAEWLHEAGIGENRAALVAHGTLWQARIELEGNAPRAGAVLDARLSEILQAHARGRLTLPDGSEAYLEPLPAGITQGATLRVRIVREGIVERGRMRPPKAVPAPGEPLTPGPTLLERIRATGHPVRELRPHEPDLLEAAGWSEVIEEAQTGAISFPGGALLMAVTPAMTLFDVDGAPPLGSLALAAATAAVRAIVRHDIGGSIGIDFPTLANKAERIAVAEAIDAALPQPFERTAVNGFGFLQIVRRRERASLPELILADPVGADARAELRRLERVLPPAPVTHRVSAAVLQRIEAHPDWRDALARRMGSRISFIARDDRR